MGAEQISRIIRGCTVCRLGLARDNEPYIVPVSFGYDGNAIYFHTAKTGRKLDFINANSYVCFEFERGVKVLSNDDNPCKWSFAFESVIGYGHVQELLDYEDKANAFKRIMKQYSSKEWSFNEKAVKNTRIWKILIESLTGKKSVD